MKRKTKTVLLIRHGLTAENRRGVYLGREDVPLCREGREALSMVRCEAVDMVYSSPLQRCAETAKLLYPGKRIQIVEALQERDFGIFSGMTHSEITALPGYGDWGMDPSRMPFPGGEQAEDFRLRCRSAWEQVVSGLCGNRAHSCAVVTHGGVIMGIMDQLFAGPGFYHWQCGNGCGYRMEMADSMTYRDWDGREQSGA